MNREHLEHILRAASSIAGVTDLVVIGSQAILATYPEWELPREATMSVEADIAIDSDLARLDVATDESELVDGPHGRSIVHLDVVGVPEQAIDELRHAHLLPR